MPGSNPYISVPICAGGQRADLDIKDIPNGSMFYSRNWVYESGVFRTRNGIRTFGNNIGARPLAITQYDHNDGNRRTVIATPTKWWNYNLSTLQWTDVSDPLNLLTGSYDSVQNLRAFYKAGVCYLIGVNGHSDKPKKWDGTAATWGDIGGTPYPAKCIATIANRVLLGNLAYGGGNHPCDIDVSSLNEFETGWNAATELVTLEDTPGEITEMREFSNNNLAIYKTDAICMGTATSATYPFTFQTVQSGIRGPLNSRAVVSTPLNHYFLSPDCNIYMFNGYQVTPLPQAIQTHIFQTADLNSIKYAFGYYRSQKSEIRFVYPEAITGQYVGIRIHLSDSTVWPDTWANIKPTTGIEAIIQIATLIGDLINPISFYTSSIGSWRSNHECALLANQDGQVYENNPINMDDDGTPIEAELITGLVGQADARRYYQVQESEHFFEPTDSSQNVNVLMGYSESGENPWDAGTFDGPAAIDISTTLPKKIGHRINSRMFSLYLYFSATQRVQWRGSQVNWIPRGYR